MELFAQFSLTTLHAEGRNPKSQGMEIDKESLFQYSVPGWKFLQDINQHRQDIDHWKTRQKRQVGSLMGIGKLVKGLDHQ
jgi:hypothetical protein